MKEIGGVKFDKANDRWSLLVKLNVAQRIKEKNAVRIRGSWENDVKVENNLQ